MEETMKRGFENIKNKVKEIFSPGKDASRMQSIVYAVSLTMLIISLVTVTSMSIQKAVSNRDPAGNEYDTMYVVDMETEETDPVTESEGDGLPTGGMLVKQRKYNYKEDNVMILDISNRTSGTYDIIIKAHYLDENGKVIRNTTRVFEGFPSGYQNYFVFNPGISFAGFNFELSGVKSTEPSYAQYFKAGEKASARTCWGHVDENGRFIIPIGEEQVNYFPREVMVDCVIEDNIFMSCEKRLGVVGDVVLFDKYGDIYYIGDANVFSNRNDTLAQSFSLAAFPPVTTGIPVTEQPNGADINRWPLPDELSSVTGLYAVKEVYPADERETKYPRIGKYWREP